MKGRDPHNALASLEAGTVVKWFNNLGLYLAPNKSALWLLNRAASIRSSIRSIELQDTIIFS